MADSEKAAIRSLAITNIAPHYRAYTSHDVQDWAYPFVILEGTAEVDGKRVPVALSSPILKK